VKHDPIRAKILGAKLIPNIDIGLAEALGLKPHLKSLGLITTDIDDVSYTALDEATKKADVEVVYARSLYAGSKNASTKLAGEFIGIIAGPNPEEVRSGLDAAIDFVENDACFYSANDDNTIPYYAHCISRSGTYLSKTAGVEAGESLAYLIAPPLEAMYALDSALKAADVRMVAFYGPPTETNFAGGLLTGSQSACKAACEAFAAAVILVAENPSMY
jgi:ethanolamine utilization protein EutL